MVFLVGLNCFGRVEPQWMPEHPSVVCPALCNSAQLAASLVVILTCGPIGERAQGSLRFAVFVGIACVAGTLLAAVIEVLGYVSLRDANFLFRPVHGTAGLCTTLALAAHQAAPDLVLLALPAALPSGALRARRAPISCAVWYGLLAGLGFGLDGILLGACLSVGWLYLRYFQPPSGSSASSPAVAAAVGAAGRTAAAAAADGSAAGGDGRDHMAAVALLPQPLRGLLSPLASVCGAITRPCLPRELGMGNSLPEADGGGGATASPAYAAMRAGAAPAGEAPVLGADDGPGTGGALDAVAERRRAKARKALDTRLAELERRRLQRGPRVSQARLLAGADGAAAGATRAGEGEDARPASTAGSGAGAVAAAGPAGAADEGEDGAGV